VEQGGVVDTRVWPRKVIHRLKRLVYAIFVLSRSVSTNAGDSLYAFHSCACVVSGFGVARARRSS
jgi:hypothetical protein